MCIVFVHVRACGTHATRAGILQQNSHLCHTPGSLRRPRPHDEKRRTSKRQAMRTRYRIRKGDIQRNRACSDVKSMKVKTRVSNPRLRTLADFTAGGRASPRREARRLYFFAHRSVPLLQADASLAAAARFLLLLFAHTVLVSPGGRGAPRRVRRLRRPVSARGARREARADARLTAPQPRCRTEMAGKGREGKLLRAHEVVGQGEGASLATPRLLDGGRRNACTA